MKKMIAAALAAVLLSGCANQALNIKPQPTDLGGYWSSHGIADVNLLIRPDGTAVWCATNPMESNTKPYLQDLVVAGDKLGQHGKITRTGPDSFTLKQFIFTYKFNRVVHAPAACKQYF